MRIPKFAVTTSRPTGLPADALVVGTVEGPDGLALAPGAEDVEAAFDGMLVELLRNLGATGKPDDVVKVTPQGVLPVDLLVATGLGRPKSEGVELAEQVRRASGAAARALSGKNRIATTLSRIDLAAAVEGTALGAYTFTTYKTDADAVSAPIAHVELLAPTRGSAGEYNSSIIKATGVSEAVYTARDLVNTPPNDLCPSSFAERATALAREAGIETEVLDETELSERGFAGILAVGCGSSRPPRLVRLRYIHRAARAKVALVGKGITFDTGGISIKPADSMADMTCDMAGAAAVVATVVHAAQQKYPLEVTATIPMAENMPSGTAYRPADVLHLYPGGTVGKTVEVISTDAEGRLVLAEAITRACEDEPDYLIETSTLTGAQRIALGGRRPGIMGDAAFRDRVARISRDVGEGGWSMPLPEELRCVLDSTIADITNVPGGTDQKAGGMLVGGLFLGEFVPVGLPWVHIDIAGPAYNTGAPWGYTPKGATGLPVRTLKAVLTDIAEHR